MKLLVFSDLHLEHRPDWTLATAFPAFDVAVVPGDVEGSPAASVAALAAAPGLRGKPIVFVAGNHEYYSGVLEERLREGLAASEGSSVRMLDKSSAVIGGVRFVGATLWTDHNLFGDPVTAQAAAFRMMNDHRLIRTSGGGRNPVPFAPGHAIERHLAERWYIEEELAKAFDGPTVVVTHHGPHPLSVHPKWKDDPVTPSFVSDLSAPIRRFQPDAWIHGHIHQSVDYRVGRTRVLANPKGYGPGASWRRIENPDFVPDLVIEV